MQAAFDGFEVEEPFDLKGEIGVSHRMRVRYAVTVNVRLAEIRKKRNTMNWERLFTKRILDRGYDYYLGGAVENMEITEGTIAAKVTGTEEYDVKISIDKCEVTDMYCSCPYASDGKNCKHMAAVLYEWSEEEDDVYDDEDDEAETDNYKTDDIKSYLFKYIDTTDAYKKKTVAVEELVQSADEEAVRSFLARVLMEDEKLLLRFKNAANRRVTQADVNNYIRQVDIIAERYLGKNRFIDYYEADSFTYELEEIVDKDVREMIDTGNYLSAFKILNYIFLLIGEVDMDDSGGGASMLTDRICQLWRDILSKTKTEEKKTMFDWFRAHLGGSVIDYLEEDIECILMEEFKEKEFEQEKLNLIKEMISKAERSGSDWSRDFDIEKWTLRYLKFLEEKGASDEQIDAVCEKYWVHSSVRRFCIDRCMEKKEYDRALRVLDESIALDKGCSRRISEYSEKKKEIYLIQGDRDAYLNQLWQLVMEHRPGDMELYRELKGQYSEEEWIKKREEIFSGQHSRRHAAEMYREEKLYDRLLELCVNSLELYTLQNYEDLLKNEYPAQILTKYESELDKMAMHTGGRKHYVYLVSLLRRMQRIEGGEEAAKRIADEWRVKYGNRPAMMDELRKL